MNKLNILATLVILFFSQSIFAAMFNEPDSAYIIAYSTTKNGGHNGLHVAWSTDKQNWNAIGPEYRYLFCDYGRWGKEKRMVTPFLFQDENQLWHCVWSLNEYDGVFAHATSKDLIYWKPQTYPEVMTGNNCMMPEMSFDKSSELYTITWLSTANNDTLVYGVTTKDFKQYTDTKQLTLSSRLNNRENVLISQGVETGIVYKVPWSAVEL